MKQHLKACLIALSLTLCITPVVRALTITTFDPPDSIVTEVSAINNAGTIAGDFDDSSFVRRGYVRKADGTITTFDSPGSTSTFAVGINNAGTIAGLFLDSGDMFHGYERRVDGTITTFDPPDSTLTFFRDINDAGTIVGFFFCSIFI